jgi:hypothetical protein
MTRPCEKALLGSRILILIYLVKKKGTIIEICVNSLA